MAHFVMNVTGSSMTILPLKFPSNSYVDIGVVCKAQVEHLMELIFLMRFDEILEVLSF